jgi:general stress protein YciG
MNEKSKRGFASMDPEKHRKIASSGGKAVSPEKRNFFDPAKASAAGKKSVQVRTANHWARVAQRMEKANDPSA